MRPLDKELCETEPGDRYYNYRKDLRTALPQIIAVSVKNLLILGKYILRCDTTGV